MQQGYGSILAEQRIAGFQVLLKNQGASEGQGFQEKVRGCLMCGTELQAKPT